MAGAHVIERFGASVRNLRFRLGISQEELANRADLHRTYIAGVEGGTRNITLKSIAKLAGALEVSIAQLLGEPDENTAAAGHDAAIGAGRPVDILLIEDDRFDVEMTLHAFKEARIANTVHVVPSGEEALEFLFGTGRYVTRRDQLQPRVILLDLNLPKMNGFDVLRRIKQDAQTRDIPVVVLTVSQQSRDIALSRQLGAKTYIVKPVDFQSFSRVTPELNMDWALVEPQRSS